MTPPAVEVHLEYPRQSIFKLPHTNIINFAIQNRIVAIDNALQVIDNINTNHCRESGERPAIYYEHNACSIPC